VSKARGTAGPKGVVGAPLALWTPSRKQITGPVRTDRVSGLRWRGDRGLTPRRVLALVAERAVLHEDGLAANWERAGRDEPLKPI
jgi:hypothetical protein